MPVYTTIPSGTYSGQQYTDAETRRANSKSRKTDAEARHLDSQTDLDWRKQYRREEQDRIRQDAQRQKAFEKARQQLLEASEPKAQRVALESLWAMRDTDIQLYVLDHLRSSSHIDPQVRLQFLGRALEQSWGRVYHEALAIVPTALQDYVERSDRFAGKSGDSVKAALEERIEQLQRQGVAEANPNSGQTTLVKGLDKMLAEIRTKPLNVQQKSDLCTKGLQALIETDSRWFDSNHRTAGFFNLKRAARRSAFKRVVNTLLRHV